MTSSSLAILVIDENRIRASIIEAGLRETGHDNVTVVHDITGIARIIAEISPDVIVIDLENPNRDVLENMFQLSRVVKRPIVMFVDRSDRASIEAAVDAGVSAYVVDGLEARAREADPPHGDQPCRLELRRRSPRCASFTSRARRNRPRIQAQTRPAGDGLSPPTPARARARTAPSPRTCCRSP